MLKLANDNKEDMIFIGFLQQCTDKANPRYYRAKQISAELNKVISSAKIAYYLAHWHELTDSEYKIEQYSQYGNHATWRIERCH